MLFINKCTQKQIPLHLCLICAYWCMHKDRSDFLYPYYPLMNEYLGIFLFISDKERIFWDWKMIFDLGVCSKLFWSIISFLTWMRHASSSQGNWNLNGFKSNAIGQGRYCDAIKFCRTPTDLIVRVFCQAQRHTSFLFLNLNQRGKKEQHKRKRLEERGIFVHPTEGGMMGVIWSERKPHTVGNTSMIYVCVYADDCIQHSNRLLFFKRRKYF